MFDPVNEGQHFSTQSGTGSVEMPQAYRPDQMPLDASVAAGQQVTNEVFAEGLEFNKIWIAATAFSPDDGDDENDSSLSSFSAADLVLRFQENSGNQRPQIIQELLLRAAGQGPQAQQAAAQLQELIVQSIDDRTGMVPIVQGICLALAQRPQDAGAMLDLVGAAFVQAQRGDIGSQPGSQRHTNVLTELYNGWIRLPQGTEQQALAQAFVQMLVALASDRRGPADRSEEDTELVTESYRLLSECRLAGVMPLDEWTQIVMTALNERLPATSATHIERLSELVAAVPELSPAIDRLLANVMTTNLPLEFSAEQRRTATYQRSLDLYVAAFFARLQNFSGSTVEFLRALAGPNTDLVQFVRTLSTHLTGDHEWLPSALATLLSKDVGNARLPLADRLAALEALAPITQLLTLQEIHALQERTASLLRLPTLAVELERIGMTPSQLQGSITTIASHLLHSGDRETQQAALRWLTAQTPATVDESLIERALQLLDNDYLSWDAANFLLRAMAASPQTAPSDLIASALRERARTNTDVLDALVRALFDTSADSGSARSILHELAQSSPAQMKRVLLSLLSNGSNNLESLITEITALPAPNAQAMINLLAHFARQETTAGTANRFVSMSLAVLSALTASPEATTARTAIEQLQGLAALSDDMWYRVHGALQSRYRLTGSEHLLPLMARLWLNLDYLPASANEALRLIAERAATSDRALSYLISFASINCPAGREAARLLQQLAAGSQEQANRVIPAINTRLQSTQLTLTDCPLLSVLANHLSGQTNREIQSGQALRLSLLELYEYMRGLANNDNNNYWRESLAQLLGRIAGSNAHNREQLVWDYVHMAPANGQPHQSSSNLTLGASQSDQIQRNARGQIVSAVTATGQRILPQYDERGTLIALTIGDTTWELRDANGKPRWVNNRGEVFNGEIALRQDGSVERIYRALDGSILRTEITTVSGRTIWLDAAGRITYIVQPDGSWQHFVYSPQGFVCQVRDSRGNLITSNDGLEYRFHPPGLTPVVRGLLTIESDGRLCFQCGDTRIVREPTGDLTVWNAAGFMEERRRPDGSAVRYNEHGQIIETRTATGIVRLFAYASTTAQNPNRITEANGAVFVNQDGQTWIQVAGPQVPGRTIRQGTYTIAADGTLVFRRTDGYTICYRADGSQVETDLLNRPVIITRPGGQTILISYLGDTLEPIRIQYGTTVYVRVATGVDGDTWRRESTGSTWVVRITISATGTITETTGNTVVQLHPDGWTDTIRNGVLSSSVRTNADGSVVHRNGSGQIVAIVTATGTHMRFVYNRQGCLEAYSVGNQHWTSSTGTWWRLASDSSVYRHGIPTPSANGTLVFTQTDSGTQIITNGDGSTVVRNGCQLVTSITSPSGVTMHLGYASGHNKPNSLTIGNQTWTTSDWHSWTQQGTNPPVTANFRLLVNHVTGDVEQSNLDTGTRRIYFRDGSIRDFDSQNRLVVATLVEQYALVANGTSPNREIQMRLLAQDMATRFFTASPEEKRQIIAALLQHGWTAGSHNMLLPIFRLALLDDSLTVDQQLAILRCVHGLETPPPFAVLLRQSGIVGTDAELRQLAERVILQLAGTNGRQHGEALLSQLLSGLTILRTSPNALSDFLLGNQPPTWNNYRQFLQNQVGGGGTIYTAEWFRNVLEAFANGNGSQYQNLFDLHARLQILSQKLLAAQREDLTRLAQLQQNYQSALLHLQQSASGQTAAQQVQSFQNSHNGAQPLGVTNPTQHQYHNLQLTTITDLEAIEREIRQIKERLQSMPNLSNTMLACTFQNLINAGQTDLYRTIALEHYARVGEWPTGPLSAYINPDLVLRPLTLSGLPVPPAPTFTGTPEARCQSALNYLSSYSSTALFRGGDNVMLCNQLQMMDLHHWGTAIRQIEQEPSIQALLTITGALQADLGDFAQVVQALMGGHTCLPETLAFVRRHALKLLGRLSDVLLSVDWATVDRIIAQLRTIVDGPHTSPGLRQLLRTFTDNLSQMREVFGPSTYAGVGPPPPARIEGIRAALTAILDPNFQPTPTWRQQLISDLIMLGVVTSAIVFTPVTCGQSMWVTLLVVPLSALLASHATSEFLYRTDGLGGLAVTGQGSTFLGPILSSILGSTDPRHVAEFRTRLWQWIQEYGMQVAINALLLGTGNLGARVGGRIVIQPPRTAQSFLARLASAVRHYPSALGQGLAYTGSEHLADALGITEFAGGIVWEFCMGFVRGRTIHANAQIRYRGNTADFVRALEVAGWRIETNNGLLFARTPEGLIVHLEHVPGPCANNHIEIMLSNTGQQVLRLPTDINANNAGSHQLTAFTRLLAVAHQHVNNNGHPPQALELASGNQGTGLHTLPEGHVRVIDQALQAHLINHSQACHILSDPKRLRNAIEIFQRYETGHISTETVRNYFALTSAQHQYVLRSLFDSPHLNRVQLEILSSLAISEPHLFTALRALCSDKQLSTLANQIDTQQHFGAATTAIIEACRSLPPESVAARLSLLSSEARLSMLLALSATQLHELPPAAMSALLEGFTTAHFQRLVQAMPGSHIATLPASIRQYVLTVLTPAQLHRLTPTQLGGLLHEMSTHVLRTLSPECARAILERIPANELAAILSPEQRLIMIERLSPEQLRNLGVDRTTALLSGLNEAQLALISRENLHGLASSVLAHPDALPAELITRLHNALCQHLSPELRAVVQRAAEHVDNRSLSTASYHQFLLLLADPVNAAMPVGRARSLLRTISYIEGIGADLMTPGLMRQLSTLTAMELVLLRSRNRPPEHLQQLLGALNDGTLSIAALRLALNNRSHEANILAVLSNSNNWTEFSDPNYRRRVLLLSPQRLQQVLLSRERHELNQAGCASRTFYEMMRNLHADRSLAISVNSNTIDQRWTATRDSLGNDGYLLHPELSERIHADYGIRPHEQLSYDQMRLIEQQLGLQQDSLRYDHNGQLMLLSNYVNLIDTGVITPFARQFGLLPGQQFTAGQLRQIEQRLGYAPGSLFYDQNNSLVRRQGNWQNGGFLAGEASSNQSGGLVDRPALHALYNAFGLDPMQLPPFRPPNLGVSIGGQNMRIEISRGVQLSIGRSGDIQSTSPLTSRHHASLVIDSNGIMFIIDLNSRHGTFVNGHRIDPGQRVRIQVTDQIMIGNQQLTLSHPR